MKKTLMTNKLRKVHLFSHIQKIDGKTKIFIVNGPTRRTVVAEATFIPNVGLTNIVIYTDQVHCNDIYMFLCEALEENKDMLISMCLDTRNDVDTVWPLKKFYYHHNNISLAIQYGTTREDFFRACEKAWKNFSNK